MKLSRIQKPSVTLALVGLGAIMIVPGTANADPPGIALDRFEPSERGIDWFSGDSLDLRGSMRFEVGVVGDWTHKPLVLRDEDGGERTALVADHLFIDSRIRLAKIPGTRVRGMDTTPRRLPSTAF